VTVVDTDPSSGSTEIVTAAFPGVRYVPACHHGLSAARNIGIRSCHGAVIGFAADDVTVHPGWIGVWQRVFDDPEIIAATGLVLPAELATPAQYAHQNGELWDFRAAEFGRTFFRSWRRIGVPTWWLGTGANMAFRRQAFERVGSFDERLGAGAAGSSEDCELWYRLLEAGHRCRYEPAAVAFHTHRTDWKGLSVQTFTQMRGHVAALLFQFDRYRHRGNVNRALLVLPYRVLTLAVQALKRTVLTQDAGGGEALPPVWPQVRGVLAGYGYYLRHRRLRAAAEIDDARPTDYSPDSPGATAPV
jgi:GT2 family glycosyltransferase